VRSSVVTTNTNVVRSLEFLTVYYEFDVRDLGFVDKFRTGIKSMALLYLDGDLIIVYALDVWDTSSVPRVLCRSVHLYALHMHYDNQMQLSTLYVVH